MVGDRTRLVWLAQEIGSIYETGSAGCAYRLVWRKKKGVSTSKKDHRIYLLRGDTCPLLNKSSSSGSLFFVLKNHFIFFRIKGTYPKNPIGGNVGDCALAL